MMCRVAIQKSSHEQPLPTVLYYFAIANELVTDDWRSSKSRLSPRVMIAISGRHKNRTSIIEVPMPRLTYIFVPRNSCQPSRNLPQNGGVYGAPMNGNFTCPPWL